MNVFRMSTLISLVFAFASVQAPAGAKLPRDAEFYQDFLSSPAGFRLSTLRSLPAEQRTRYLSSSKEELKIECARALWERDNILPAFKMLVATSRYRDLQADLAADWMILDNLTFCFYGLRFYSEDPYEYVQWVADIGAAICRRTAVRRDERLFLLAVMAARNAEGDSRFKERCFWSAILSRPVDVDELDALADDPDTVKRFLEGFESLNCGMTRILMGQFDVVPNKTWESAWTRYNQERGPYALDLEAYIVLRILGSRKGQGRGGQPPTAEDDRKWIESLTEWLHSRRENMDEDSAWPLIPGATDTQAPGIHSSE